MAFALALPAAWERYRSDRRIGLRTFPIVAMASCGLVLIANPSAGESPETLARILQELLSGIGFIGGGAILKHRADVKGLTTAASVWCTGAIGAAVAYGRLEIAAVLSIVTFLTLQFLTPVAKDEDEEDSSG